ncbi:MAG TPA: glycosyltransferase family 4 protein [Acidimicrobiales bacterium]|nr:glycosyltransferase family 4 protein [Acidimicrobiales bacterium]
MKPVDDSRPVERRVRPLLVGMGWFPDQPGGLNRFLRGLLEALRTDGVEARAAVVGPAADGPPHLQARARHRSPAILRASSLGRSGRKAAPDVDVVDAHFAPYTIPVLLGSRRLRHLPLVVHFHGPWADEVRADGEGREWVIDVKRAVERAVYRRAQQAVVLTAAFKRILVETYGMSPWNVHVVPPGVDLERFRPGDRLAARRQLGVDTGAWVALSVRRLVPRMGLETLVEAWAKLREEDPGAVLLIAGDGPSRPTLEYRVHELGLGSAVRFLGPVSDEELEAAYRAADVSVVPSLALEGFGLIVLESLATGTPVIATDVGGLPEALAGLDASLVVPPDDPSALADRLLAARRGERPLPSPERCRRHAETFSWERSGRRTMEIYARAVEDRGDRRIRVVFLDHVARLSGAELGLTRLLPALHGIDAHVILAEEGPLVGRLQRIGTSVEVLPMAERARTLSKDKVRPGAMALGTAASTGWYVLRLARRLRQLQPDIVHTNSLKAALYGVAAARLAGVPTVWHIRDRIAPDYLPRAAVRLVQEAAGHFPTAVIGNSESTLATLRVPLRHAVIPSPVLIHETVARPSDPERTSHPSLRVGIVGRLAPWKGQDLFLRAFAEAFPDGDAEAVVIGAALFGEDQYAGSLHRLVRELRLERRVSFTGFRDDVAAELARLDVLVHASTIPEPFGQVVVEGMAARLPVVAPDAGGPAEIITHGLDGLLYPMGDPRALARHLRSLAADAGLRGRLGAAGYERAIDFSPESAAAKVMQVYRGVLSDRSPRPVPRRTRSAQ